MQNFFLVSVAIGFFSGTTLTAKAQPAVNMEQVNLAVAKKPIGFNNTSEFKSAAETLKAVADVAPIESFTALQFKYAQLLDVEVESITNRALFASIEKWWSTRYRYGGANEKGIDCSA